MHWGYPGIFSSVARQKRMPVIMSTFTPNQPAAPGPKHSKQQGEQISSVLPFACDCYHIPSAGGKSGRFSLKAVSCMLGLLSVYHHRHHRKSPISQCFTAVVDLLSVSDAVFLSAEKKYKTIINNQCLFFAVFPIRWLLMHFL